MRAPPTVKELLAMLDEIFPEFFEPRTQQKSLKDMTESDFNAVHDFGQPVGTKPYAVPKELESLTDAEIQMAITKAVKEKRLYWLWYSLDDCGSYTIPVTSTVHYQFARVIETALKEKNHD